MKRRLALALLLTLLPALAGCQAAGSKEFKEAKAEYEALVLAGVPPMDPRFSVLRLRLEQIPEKSPHKELATKLAANILRLQRQLPPRPLAAAPPRDAGLPEAFLKKQQECVELAKALSNVPSEERAARVERLSRCRAELEAEKAHHHAEDDPVAH